MTHGLLLKYILSHGTGIDVFFTLFGGFLDQGFKEIEVYFASEEI